MNSEEYRLKTDRNVISIIENHIENIHQIGFKTVDKIKYIQLLEETNNGFAESLRSLAHKDPVLYPFGNNDKEELSKTIEECASSRFALPQIPISYFYDVIQGEKVYTPGYVDWQQNGNKKKNFVLSYFDDESKRHAIETTNQMVVSILLAFPVKKVHINIIDLDNTLDFVFLSGNIGKKLVTLISNNSELNEFNQHIEAIIKKSSSTPGFSTAEEYNTNNKSISAPYELVLVANYKSSTFSRIEDTLVSTFQNGNKFGVYFFVLNDTSAAPVRDNSNNFLANKDVYLNVDVNSINSFKDNTNIPGALINTVSYANDAQLQEKVLNYINSAIEKKTVYLMDWDNMVSAPYCDTDADIEAPIGFKDDGQVFNFRMGVSNSHYHAFVIGATGSGKSRFLHDIILSMSLKYKPEDLELYLMDFKGVEFNDYKDFKHVRSVLVNRADEQITYEVIKDLKSRMEERERILRNSGASDVAEYNRNNLGEHLTQIIFIADECQALFADRAKNGALQNEIVDIIALIAQQGRAYGVHLMLATQSIANAPQLGKEILNQISDYYILPCLPADATRLVPDYARLETENIVAKMEKGKGQCYYFSQQEHFVFTYNYVSKGEMQSNLVNSSIEKAKSHNSNGQIYFSGSLQYELNDTIADFLMKKKGHSILASPGQEIGLTQRPITIPLKADFSENILLLGINDEHFVTRTAMNVLVSLMITNIKKEYGYRFIVFDCLADDEADYFELLDELETKGLCKIVDGRRRAETLKQICDGIASNMVEPTILMILGQDRFRDLKLNMEIKTDDNNLPQSFGDALSMMSQISLNASKSNATSAEIKTVSDAMNYILEKGPEADVHTIMQLDEIANFLFMEYVGKNDIYKKFKHLVMLRSKADAAVKLSLNDNIHLDRMESNPDRLRAYYYNEESDKYQLFTPFTLPVFDNIKNLIGK